MPSFPDVLATSYSSGSTPVVKAADLNAMQAETVRLWRAVRGGDFLLDDDFTGDSLNRAIWTDPRGAVTLQPDSDQSGAMGTAILSPAAAALISQALPFGTMDFRFVAAMRFPNYPSLATGGEFAILLSQSLGATLGFRITRTDSALSNVLVRTDGPGAGLPRIIGQDTGVDVPVTSYARFEIRRQGALISFLINDFVVFSFAYTGTLPGMRVLIQPVTAIVGQIDYFKLHAVRLPVSSATLGQALGSHVESKTVAFDGSQDFVDLTWTVPFADTTYRLPAPGVYVAFGPNTVTATYARKTQTGIRVVPSARFTGEVYVDAHE
jgi:hypothetical protein